MSEIDPTTSRRDWIRSVLQATATVGIAGLALADDDWRPVFFSAEPNAQLVSLAECIVPGSAAAGCNRLIDLLLSLESEKHQDEMRNALQAFDRESRRAYGKPFQAINSGEQDQILTSASTGTGPLYEHFRLVKEWVADAYWSSKEGLHELGWKGRLAWTSFDGCPHSGAHS